MSGLTVSQLYIYPVKSLAGIRVDRWPVDARGLRYDRRWMLIDDKNCFLSQRRMARMALIKTRLTNRAVILSTPDQKQIEVPLNMTSNELIQVKIWDDFCNARPVSREIDRWLGAFLGCDCRLVFQPDDSIRPVDPRFAGVADQTSFSDGFPFLIVSESSLRSLNQAMDLELPVNRFRPNLVISGASPFEEDVWREIRINNICFRLPKPCSRCNIPTIDQDTAISAKEPLKTLNMLRKWNKRVYFGQNALHDGPGEIATEIPVEILETGPRQPPL